MQEPPPHGNDVEDEVDEEESSKEELDQEPPNVLQRSITKPPVIFPTESEYRAGYFLSKNSQYS